jgi:predicted HTH transcriptional regulator
MREIQRIVPPIVLKDPLLVKDEKTMKTISLLSIEKSTDQLRYINNEVFIRGKKSNKKLTPSEIIKYSYAKGFEKADKELVKVDFSLLDTDYYRMRKESRKIPHDTIENVLFQT